MSRAQGACYPMNTTSKADPLRSVISEEQIEKRVREMAGQISKDYRGKTIHAIALLENSFVFMADLVRALEVPVVCAFVKPRYRNQPGVAAGVLEIVFSHGLDIRDREVLLVEGLVDSGVTSEFLMNDLRARGAASVKLATLLDRQAGRRVPLQPDYCGFVVDERYLVGYGLGGPDETQRNLPYLAAISRTAPMT